MDFRFAEPGMLWWGALALPLGWLGWRAMGGMDLARKVAAVGLRAGLIMGLAVMLARPYMEREHDHLTVIGVLDVSGSVRVFGGLGRGETADDRDPRPVDDDAEGGLSPDKSDSSAPLAADPTSNIDALRMWFRQAVGGKGVEDRVGLVVFDGEQTAIATPTRGDYGDDNIDLVMEEGTDIAGALEFATALFPPDTARRLVLATDGNETTGDVLEALGKVGFPVDVLPVPYVRTGDVQVVRVEAPPRSRPGERVRVRMVLESTVQTTGTLSLYREGEEVDINGSRRGLAREISVPVGRSVQGAEVKLDDRPLHRFRAVFEPDEPRHDAVGTNNEAESFTVTHGKGLVLIVSEGEEGGKHILEEWLRQAETPAQVKRPLEFPQDLLALQQYDLVVLDNIPAYALSREQHELIRRYVEDLGGGLVMIGGERSFGVGGWNGTAVEEVLPVEMDPPQELRAPSAALVLVLDKSGSMNRPVAGARATQQVVANRAAALAIESLRSESLVGVIAFDFGVQMVVPMQRNDDPRRLAAEVMNIRAEGGTDLEPALEKALAMLLSVEASKKRVVCLSDGQSESSPGALEAIAERMLEHDIRLTTIAVGDDADTHTLNRLANLGGGEFHTVRNPKMLPRVLVDSVQQLNTPLIKEGSFRPRILPTGSLLTAGMEEAPELRGMVITAIKSDRRIELEMVHDGAEQEPLLAQGQMGLGRSAAFMSDLGGPWSRDWLSWEGARPFWLQLMRVTSRPGSITGEGSMEFRVGATGDELHLVLEAGEPADNEREHMDYLEVTGTAYSPSGKSIPVRLRQTAPGRYEGRAPAPEAGNYIVTISPKRGTRRLSPLIAGTTRSGGMEYRRMETNMRLLEEIVRRSGGRRLDERDPGAVDLFDRAGLPTSVSALPAWPWLLWIALGVFLLDVAGRRLAWSGKKVAEQIVGWARLFRPGVRGEASVVGLAALREYRGLADEELPAPETRPIRETRTILEPPSPLELRTSAELSPDPERVQSALDALSGREGAGAERTAGDGSGPDESEGEERGPEDGPEERDTTQQLLEAKRRARERREEE